MPGFFVRLAVAAAILLSLAACGRSESYRYKLTLAVNTPDGVKRGSECRRGAVLGCFDSG
jgi:hypothetical protein